MVLKLYGNVESPNSKRVAVVLYEKKIPFEYHNIEFSKREHKAPDFLEKQPFGAVPYLDDDGFILYESRAIARYLDEKYPDNGPRLVPTDPKKKALFEQAASIETANFNTYVGPMVFEMLYKGFYGGTPDIEKYNHLLESLSQKLDVYDKILAKQKYLAGDELTLADLFHLPFGAMLSVIKCDAIEKRPNVARWFKEISERESWIAVKDEIKSLDA